MGGRFNEWLVREWLSQVISEDIHVAENVVMAFRARQRTGTAVASWLTEARKRF